MAVVPLFLLAALFATHAESVLEGARALEQAKPIAKVIKLMKDMLQELESDQEADEKIYEQMSCWCKNGEKEKNKEIAEGEMTAKTLASSIEELTAKQEKLKKTIASTTEALAKNKEALADATGIRDKEVAEFNKADKDAIQAIGGLRSAVQVLSKHQEDAGAALPQEALLLQLRRSLRSSHGGKPHSNNVLGGRPRGLALLQQQQQQQPVSALQEAYASGNSNEIFGVLQSMKESFEANQATARKEEATSAAEFATMSKAKKEEIATNAKTKSEKSVELGITAEALENAKIESKDTNDQLDDNRQFLSQLQSQCSKIDAEWEIRKKMRQDETTAVAEALEILTDDSARELAAKTTSFLQIKAANHRLSARMRAAMLLATTGKHWGKPLLSLVATELQSDVFDKIKESIDAMVVTLKQEAKDEVKQKDWCTEKLNDNERDTAAAYDKKKRLETKKSDLEAAIARLTDELKVATTELVDTQLEMHDATENRQMESKEYTQTISDQRAMGEILTKALARLKQFYSKKGSLLQTSRGGQEPPAGFKPYEDKSPAAGGVVGMLNQIVKESHETQKHAIFDNMEAQMAYEEFMREANKSIHRLQKSINDKKEEKAQADADAERVDADLKRNLEDLEALDAVKHELQGTCGFLLDNFDHRVEARTQEIDALNEAKNIMGGS